MVKLRIKVCTSSPNPRRRSAFSCINRDSFPIAPEYSTVQVYKQFILFCSLREQLSSLKASIKATFESLYPEEEPVEIVRLRDSQNCDLLDTFFVADVLSDDDNQLIAVCEQSNGAKRLHLDYVNAPCPQRTIATPVSTVDDLIREETAALLNETKKVGIESEESDTEESDTEDSGGSEEEDEPPAVQIQPAVTVMPAQPASKVEQQKSESESEEESSSEGGGEDSDESEEYSEEETVTNSNPVTQSAPATEKPNQPEQEESSEYETDSEESSSDGDFNPTPLSQLSQPALTATTSPHPQAKKYGSHIFKIPGK